MTTLRDDKPAIARRVHAMLVLTGAKWSGRADSRNVSEANVTLEYVTETLNEWYAELEEHPEYAAQESGGIRIVRDRDLGKLDVFVLAGQITHESPACECQEGELLDVECPIHPLRVPA